VFQGFNRQSQSGNSQLGSPEGALARSALGTFRTRQGRWHHAQHTIPSIHFQITEWKRLNPNRLAKNSSITGSAARRNANLTGGEQSHGADDKCRRTAKYLTVVSERIHVARPGLPFGPTVKNERPIKGGQPGNSPSSNAVSPHSLSVVRLLPDTSGSPLVEGKSPALFTQRGDWWLRATRPPFFSAQGVRNPCRFPCASS